MTAKSSSDNIAKLLFLAACLFLAFIAGIAASVFEFSLYKTLSQVANKFEKYGDVDKDIPAEYRKHYLYPIRYKDSGAKTYLAESIEPGVTIVTSHWQDKENNNEPYHGAQLINEQGEVLHEWRVKLDDIWTESPHNDHTQGSKTQDNIYIHGIWLKENGDIIFNIEYMGMVRLNACTEVVWKLPYRTHHSIYENDDGNYWVSGLKWAEIFNDDYWLLKRLPYVDETLLLVSPEGEILREIFVLESMHNSGYEGLLKNMAKVKDITHLNDIEELSPTMADAFPQFNAGDLLISLRNLNSVLVIDGETEKVKWELSYPMIRQHDPDFMPYGKIIIYDNRDDGTLAGDFAKQSRIIEVDPVSKAIRTIWPLRSDQAFYSGTGGKQQLLANGNMLITESKAGRAIEITPDGEVAWEWIIEGWGDVVVPEIMEASRYPASFADFTSQPCPNP